MKYYGLWDPNYTGWRSEQVEPNYFGDYVYRLVEPNLENEFTVEDFMEKFNKLTIHVRVTNYFSSFKHTITLFPKYHYHYKTVSNCLHYMVKQKRLKAKYVSVGSRTETIFKKY